MVFVSRDHRFASPTQTHLWLGRIVLVAVLLVALSAGAVAAEGHDKNGPCPGDNPNVGLINADDAGATNSLQGIVRAGEVIGCPPIENPDLTN